ncbi:MAG: molybdopterin molybdotransferase MoeA [Steroidobacteraceae bacterium]
MLTPSDAEALIRERLACLPIESLPLAQCAGAVLRENIYAERDAPPFDRVAMDGIACAGGPLRQGQREFRVQGAQPAGDPPLTLEAPDCCIEVMTGAMLPAGCDAVVPIEQVELAAGRARITSASPPAAGANIHRRGADARQGALLLSAGTRLGAPESAIAASAGMARVRVSAQPRIAVISTGNELVEPGEPIEPWQVRRSNPYGVVAALRAHAFERVVDDHMPDDAEILAARLRFHLDTHDVLILSGGVSMGRLDLVPQTLARLGVEQVFHRIAQRPGKPMWFGTTGAGCAVFALPGNPVSTLVCLARYVIPALGVAMGSAAVAPERLPLAADCEVTTPLTTFLPVRIAHDDWGRGWAHPQPTNGSGDFMSLAGTHGFIELPGGPHRFARGHVSRLFGW